MILYLNKSADNVIGKDLEEVGRVDVRLRADIDIINPQLKIKNNGLKFNYCYIEQLKRFYFVESVQVRGRLVELVLNVDVLETYKEEINNSELVIERPIKAGDYGDFSGVAKEEKDVAIFESDLVIEKGESIILSTKGGAYNG